ncbi:MAG: transposase domain-containing protein [Verrucomicrobiales bacterium]
MATCRSAPQLPVRAIIQKRGHQAGCSWAAKESRPTNTPAILFSIVMSCRRIDLDPYAYLDDILRRVNTHPASQIDELLPDRWLQSRKAEGRDVSVRPEIHRPLRRAS